MQLDRVTITGADDAVDPVRLVELSRQYPFVEWALLFSRTKQGKTPRYPSPAWIDRLLAAAPVGMMLSAHLCGAWVRDVLAGNYQWWLDHKALHSRFGRVQFDLGGAPQAVNLGRFVYDVSRSTQIVWQVEGDNTAWVRALVGEGLGVPLFDVSGGRGTLPPVWPRSWPDVYCGYAGDSGRTTSPRSWPAWRRWRGGRARGWTWNRACGRTVSSIWRKCGRCSRPAHRSFVDARSRAAGCSRRSAA